MAFKTKIVGVVFALNVIVAIPLHAQVFFDDFNDNTNTGWTYLDRSGGTTINTFFRGGPGAPAFVEQNQQLEQTVDNYSFPDGILAQGDTGGPQLGGIALAPGTYEGPTILVDMLSLEVGNGFQDQDVVFGYQDEDNFFYVETIANGGLNLFTVIDGVRTGRANAGISFNESYTTVLVEHNGLTGNVKVTYDNAATPQIDFTDPSLELDGAFSVGVGSNNDAYAIDNFTVASELAPGAEGDANGDGFVDHDDFVLISDNMFNSVTPGENGDLDFSGLVDFADFMIWRNAPPILPGPSNPVPEPAGAFLLCSGLLALLSGRRWAPRN